jgi:hypothetical protein
MMLRTLILLSLSLLYYTSSAQNLISPPAYLGYELGNQFTPHHRVVSYFQQIAGTSPRVQLQPYGQTYEGRPLLLTFISSPENLAKLEQIREDNLKRAGIVAGEPSQDAKAIVWLSYNVHGNESVSTEAAMAVLYSLAEPNKQVAEWLENTVVVIDPCINPDGRDRYVNWYNQQVGRWPNPLPEAREHHEPWPGGRANHYLFDLNRDWAWQTQVESQQRMRVYNQWLPHVHADYHEQGVDAPYYFAPAAEPYHTYITDWQREFQTTIGRNNARYFDENGWLYFTREVFDLLYPSYGDTYPLYNGAIGMTYEQGGSGRAGLAIINSVGDTLRLSDRIAHHYVTSLATIETTARNHQQVVDKFRSFYANNRNNPPGTFRSYLFSAQSSPDNFAQFRRFLDSQGIRYGMATSAATHRGFSYGQAGNSSFRRQRGDLVISAFQPKAFLLQVLMDPETELADTLTYDITAWALPYAYGLEAYATAENIPADNWPEAEEVSVAETDGAAMPYAYLAPWTGLNSAQFLSEILQLGIKVRFSQEPFTLDGEEWGRGTLIISRTSNEALGEKVAYAVQNAAQNWEVPVKAAATGMVSKGKDFGSSSVAYLEQPQVALLSGEGTSSLNVGEIWHFFEQQLGYPVTLVSSDYAANVNWSEFDVVILPNGYYRSSQLEGLPDQLLTWVRSGGRLILMQNAMEAFVGKGGLKLAKKESKEEDKKDDKPAEEKLKRYEAREREALTNFNTGTIYRVRMDDSHPLAFGYDDTYYSLKTDADAYSYLDGGWNVGTVQNSDDLVAGYIGQTAREKLPESLVFGVEGIGQGQVVYFVDNPLFRAFWQGGKLLFANAVFMVGEE